MPAKRAENPARLPFDLDLEMAFNEEVVNSVFDSTAGRCHLCHAPVAFSNYGTFKRRGAWEIDHSVPRSRGGTDRRNNLRPACTSCNRSKQARSTRSARGKNGKSRAPLSFEKLGQKREESAVVTGLAFGLFGAAIVPGGFIFAALFGAIIGYNSEQSH